MRCSLLPVLPHPAPCGHEIQDLRFKRLLHPPCCRSVRSAHSNHISHAAWNYRLASSRLSTWLPCILTLSGSNGVPTPSAQNQPLPARSSLIEPICQLPDNTAYSLRCA